MPDTLSEKVAELTTKYNLPGDLFAQAIEMERQQVTLVRRSIVSKLVAVIERVQGAGAEGEE